MTPDGTPMDAARWARVETLFHEAAALPPAEVPDYLDRACGDDPELRRRVEELLAADTSAQAVVDRELEAYAGPLLSDDGAPEAEHLPPGTRMGRYRLLEVLGSGGMGTVYRAERADGAYERLVALKVVRSGRLEKGAQARFRREREILARLAHPGIATLLDGGVGDDGAPYLAMELIEGRAITEYADARGLDVAARVELVIQMAEAVDYAHRNLVVHRDLKPSNILVTDAGVVKLLDFGIARLVVDDGASDLHTRTGLLLLTPAYAAPEQIRGEPVTTAVDVYAIGAVLYELLAGRRPFGDAGSSWAELRRLLEEPPPPLSRGEGLDRATRRALDGDLDKITLRALHKDPLRRYPSARELAEDLHRFLEGRPVQARPDSIVYRVSKLVQRNLVASLASAALVVAVVLGVAGTLWQARVANLEAERRAGVADFMVSVFEGADPDLTPGEPVTALELLESGLGRVDSLQGGPEVRVDLLVVLGVLFGKFGHYERADAVLRQAVANAHDALGQHASIVGDVEEAEGLLRSALAARRRDGSSPAEIAATQSNLALALRRLGQYEEAADIYREVIDQVLRANAGDSLLISSDLLGLGQVLQFQERRDEAVELFTAVRRLKEDAGQFDAQLAHAIHDLGVVLAELEELDRARGAHLEALALWRRLFPDGHPEIARSLEAIGRASERQGRWAEADSIYREAIDAWSGLYGDEHSQIAALRANQANLRYFEGDFDAAAEAYRDAIRVLRAGGERRLLGTAMRNLAIIDRERGDYVSADTLLAETLALRRDLVGERGVSVAEVHSAVAGLRNRQGRFGEAEEQARAALEIYEAALEPGHRLINFASVELGAALVELGRPAEAVPVLERTRDAFVELLNEADASRGRVDLWLGSSLARLGEIERARSLIEAAIPVLEVGLGPEAPETRRARAELARLTG